jgi:histidyl-tRNA synthetase
MELTPALQQEFDKIKDVIRAEHVARGFLPIDTPLIYRKEVILARAGGETEKQIYELERGNNKLALRFDLTVPLARYVVDKQNSLNFPFKVSQIGKVYRGERAQAGRYREFYQCDADIIGRGDLDISYDAECVALVDSIYKKLDFGDFTVRISNRKLIGGFVESIGASSKLTDILAVLDRASKITPEEFVAQIGALGLESEAVSKLQNLIALKGSNSDIIGALKALKVANSEYQVGLAELERVMQLLEQQGVSTAQIDLTIVRGLDYYTGTVYETTLNGREREIGSIASGGRYENLASNYSSESYPGVGISIGLTRLFSALLGAGLVGTTAKTSIDVLVLPFSAEQFAYSYKLAVKLRADGRNVDVLTEDMKFAKKMAYANKSGVQHVVVVGSSEVKTGNLKIKDMQTGEEYPLDACGDS